ncbi:hypothetical protein [Eleftheria terrae]|uniref:hypothetical protein n=1 Tax=Eleftheria terrae TaxID=1597781 RepID=UPI00263ADC05|nr:hypothetical protein [Eleftheria terrae]WKB50569.1 hypothetical protein N7L95_00175 [Eleftheria terrae]
MTLSSSPLTFDDWMDAVEAQLAVRLNLSELDAREFISPRTCQAIGMWKSSVAVAKAVTQLAALPPSRMHYDI